MPDFCETPDFLATSTVLRKVQSRREMFNPENADHLKSLANFVKTGEWGTVSFFCETPFSDVPMTVLMKFAGSQLHVSRETTDQRFARFDAARLAAQEAGAMRAIETATSP